MNDLKTKGKLGEQLAQERYLARGYQLKAKNFTIRGGEIDLIMQKADELVFVEVKVVDGIQDWTSYLSARKFQALERSIEAYCFREGWEESVRLDVVFIAGGKVIEVYENVSNS